MSRNYYAHPLIYRRHICWAECRFTGDGWIGVFVFKGKPSRTPIHYPTSEEAIAAVKAEVDRSAELGQPLQQTWQNGLFDL